MAEDSARSVNRTPAVSIFDEIGAAGAAADAFHERSDVAQLPASEHAARQAVDLLAEHFAGLPQPIRKALAGAKSNAARLSTDRLQGLAEIIQNADDLGATEVRFQLRTTPGGRELLASHDGLPVFMADLMGLATPWLSPKADDAASTGRFGIGLMTLQSLGPELHVHSGFFHFALRPPALTSLPRRAVPAHLGGDGWTLFCVPLLDGVASEQDLAEWLHRQGQAALIFLRHVRRVVVIGASGEPLGELMTHVSPPTRVTTELEVWEQELLTADGARWRVYRRELEPPADMVRSNKARSDTTPLAIAFPETPPDALEPEVGFLHTGLPVQRIDLPFRLSAQFDPMANRQGLDTEGAWNVMLASALADLWVASALHVVARAPQAAWALVPRSTAREREWPGGKLGRVLDERLLHEAVVQFAHALQLPTPVGPRGLAALAVEAEALEDVLSPDDTARLADTDATLPPSCRDGAGRWRQVLADLASLNAPAGVPVGVMEALALMAEDCTIQVRIHLAKAAIEQGLSEELAAQPCVLDAHGRPLTPPGDDEPGALIDGEPHEVFERLGLGQRLHPAYQDSPAGRAVTDWLVGRGSLLRNPGVEPLLRRLADAGAAGRVLPEALDEQQLLALRDAIEQLAPDDRSALGPGIGAAVRLHGFTHRPGGGTSPVAVTPAEAYIIEKEGDSWYVAAGSTPGIAWLDRRYSTLLSRARSGAGMGAQKLFRILGAETAPRLVPDGRVEKRFQSYAPGVPAHAGTASRRERLRALDATHTLHDHVSPDLRLVLTHIGADKSRASRLKRANALLATLASGWTGWGDATSARAVQGYVQWNPRGDVPAAWIYEAAATPWLPNGRGTAQAPETLLRSTPANLGHYGKDPARYLHPSLATRGRQNVLDALGVAGDPPASELLAWLTDLANDTGDAPGNVVAGRASTYYQALGQMIGRPVGRTVGDVSVQRLREAFSRGSGLVYTNLGWRRPSTVFTGPPVFGDRAPFAPTGPGLERLWTLLGMRAPGARDARGVLADLASGGRTPDFETETIMLETWRVLDANLSSKEGQELRLNRLRVWTSQGWAQRPAYLVADSRLALALAELVPVWRPGGDIRQFQGLAPRLALAAITVKECSVAADVAGDLDDEATQHFRAAVTHLQIDLARNDPEAERSMSLDWAPLASFDVIVAPELAITVDGLEQAPRLRVPVKAWADEATRTLYVADATVTGRVEGGGQALAALSSVAERRISLPWRAAWDVAADDRAAELLVTAHARAQQRAEAAAAAAADLADLSQEAARDRANRGSSKTKAGKPTTAEPRPQAPPRNLIDVEDLDLLDGDGAVTSGSATPSVPRGKQAKRKEPREPDTTRPPSDKPGAGPLNYTTSEKEERALRLVFKALGKDDTQVRDIRNQRGVGADAVDGLRRFFELKTHAGEAPADVTLTDDEAKRALTDDQFFLVVVSNLEQGRGDPTVRFIVDPMRTLDIQAVSTIRLGPLKDAPGLTYTFRARLEP